jgi:Short-chain dehydrogenases of various substrate specificities
VLVARRLELLKELGQNLEKEFGVQCRAVQVDLSDENFIGTIKEATQDLDIGLVVSNAGTGNPGSFIKKNRDDLLIDVRLSVTAHWSCVTTSRLPREARTRRDSSRWSDGSEPRGSLYGE